MTARTVMRVLAQSAGGLLPRTCGSPRAARAPALVPRLTAVRACSTAAPPKPAPCDTEAASDPTSNISHPPRGPPSPEATLFSLIDVMGDDSGDGNDVPAPPPPPSPRTASSFVAEPPRHPTHRREGPPAARRDRAADADDPPVPGTSADIRRAVHKAVLEPLGAGPAPAHEEGEEQGMAGSSLPSCSGAATTTTTTASEPLSVSHSNLTVRIADKFGMPATLPRGSPKSFADLLHMSPTLLREQLEQWRTRHRARELTAVQQAAIPFILEYRDLLCIAPTATGKTFTYVFPTMLRLAMDEAVASGRRSAGASGGDPDDTGADFTRRDVEALVREKIDRGEVCRYCELSVAENPLCPMTGVPHPPPPSSDGAEMALNTRTRKAMRLEELSSVAEPRVLILVPTSQLVFQVHNVCRSFHADYNIRYMVRASSAEEQKKYLRALEGTDVLVSTPETILPALFKQKLSLRRVRTLVVDEVDDLVSTNHFEKLKIILGAMPKGAARPQRLLFGASLPPVAYHMIKERMLEPAHRFVLADVATDHLGHPLQGPHRATRVETVTGAGGGDQGDAQGPSSPSSAGGTGEARSVLAPTHGVLTGNAAITHVVFMLGRVEKIQKLAWLYSTGRLTTDQRTIIFCNSRNNVAYVHDHLQTLVPGLRVVTLTSRASVTAREGVLKMFATGVSTCLVCTDLLSRGIDFKQVMYVVHYDMPLEMETWVHRNGRTGRGGLPGYVYTFFQPENVKMAKPLTAFLRQNRQLVPPKLQEYAKQPFVEIFKKSLFHHPTRPYRRDDPQNTTPILGRGTPRFPDYRQEGIQRNFRPL